MRHNHSRTARLELHYRRDDFVAALRYVLPRIGDRVDLIGLYMLVCVFWGLVVYAAVAFAVQ